MTIKECIDRVDSNKPNQYTLVEKIGWINFIEEKIINDILKTHEGYDGRYDLFEGYTDDNLTAELIAPSPYDRLYTAYLKMKIDEENGETTRYNNSAAMFNAYYTEYKKWYNKHHMPIVGKKKAVVVPTTAKVGLTDAEFEALVRELTYTLTEKLAGAVSEDKIYDIVMRYMQNNTALFRGEPGKEGKQGEAGKDGYSPIKGIDYNDGKPGKDGTDGVDGYSPIVTVEETKTGHTVSIEDKYGLHTFDVENGKDGGSDDWNQNDETQPDYIKNRTHYETFGKNYGYTEFDLESTSMDVSDGIQTVSLTDPLEPGVAYLYKTDKGSGTFTVDFDYQYADGQVILGDTGYTGDYFKDNGGSYINFGIGYDKEGYIQIYQISVKTLDEKYIPDTIARLADVEAMIGIVNDELESILAGGVD